MLSLLLGVGMLFLIPLSNGFAAMRPSDKKVHHTALRAASNLIQSVHGLVDHHTNDDNKSDRLQKAKLLLEQFTNDDGITTVVVLNDTTQTQTTTVVLPILPDSYWSNGHLAASGGSYVTRWAQGVKVAEPLVKYDPVAAERLLFRQPTKWLVRNLQIALPIGLWAAMVVLDYIFQRPTRRERAIQLTEAISSLGPAIIKGGQALASRPDLLPSEYLEELQKLQDDGR